MGQMPHWLMNGHAYNIVGHLYDGVGGVLHGGPSPPHLSRQRGNQAFGAGDL
jgi:hypothetical protein